VRKSRFNEEQIIAILKEAEAGIAPDELCRRHGITRGSLYRWKAKYGGMEVSEARRLRQLEEENRQLKHAVAELLLDKRALQRLSPKLIVSSNVPMKTRLRPFWTASLHPLPFVILSSSSFLAHDRDLTCHRGFLRESILFGDRKRGRR